MYFVPPATPPMVAGLIVFLLSGTHNSLIMTIPKSDDENDLRELVYVPYTVAV